MKKELTFNEVVKKFENALESETYLQYALKLALYNIDNNKYKKSKHNIKDILNTVIDNINTNPEYRSDIEKYKSGTIHKIIENKLLDAGKIIYPNLQLYHPEDKKGLADICSQLYNKGIEVKITFGWKNGNSEKYRDCDIEWTNGTMQHKTEYFLFINVDVDEDGDLFVKNCWFCHFSYDDWNTHTCNGKQDKRLSLAGLKKLAITKYCKQIV